MLSLIDHLAIYLTSNWQVPRKARHQSSRRRSRDRDRRDDHAARRRRLRHGHGAADGLRGDARVLFRVRRRPRGPLPPEAGARALRGRRGAARQRPHGRAVDRAGNAPPGRGQLAGQDGVRAGSAERHGLRGRAAAEGGVRRREGHLDRVYAQGTARGPVPAGWHRRPGRRLQDHEAADGRRAGGVRRLRLQRAVGARERDPAPEPGPRGRGFGGEHTAAVAPEADDEKTAAVLRALGRGPRAVVVRVEAVGYECEAGLRVGQRGGPGGPGEGGRDDRARQGQGAGECRQAGRHWGRERGLREGVCGQGGDRFPCGQDCVTWHVIVELPR